MPHETLLLSRSDIEKLLPAEDVFAIVERVLEDHGLGRVVMPPKVSLDLGDSGRWPHLNAFINAMPAYLSSQHAAGLKWAGGFWDNRSRGLPTIMGHIVLNDPASGLCLAVMDGSWITAIRTAAVTVVAALHLGKQPIRSVAVCGAGTQGRTHLLMFDKVLHPSEFRVYDASSEALRSFAIDAQRLTRATVITCKDVNEAIANADVVVTATDAREPFLKAARLTPGTLVCAIGSYSEIHEDVVKWASVIVVDDLEQVMHRGNLAPFFQSGMIHEDSVSFRLGQIVAGKAEVAKPANVLAVLIGMGSEDVAVAKEVYERASARGVGTRFAFGSEKPIVTSLLGPDRG